MKINVVLAGLRENNVVSVLEREESFLKGLHEEACLCFIQTDGAEVKDKVKGWAGRFKGSQLYQTAGETDFKDADMSNFVEVHPANLTIFCGTAAGKELGKRVAAKLNMPCHVDVTELEKDSNKLYAVRKVYSTHAEGVYEIKDTEATLLTVSPDGAKEKFQFLNETENVTAEIIEPVEKQAHNYKLIKEELIPQTENLGVAKVVVIGGNGLGNIANFERLEALAEKLGVSCGCSRLAALSGWAGYDKIVGISGWSLQADVCIAFGVSGAGPLMQGLEGVGKLVAVNNDRKAPIFRKADYGIEEDCLKIIEAMEKIAEEKGTV